MMHQVNEMFMFLEAFSFEIGNHDFDFSVSNYANAKPHLLDYK
jgi:hypothetical protein